MHFRSNVVVTLGALLAMVLSAVGLQAGSKASATSTDLLMQDDFENGLSALWDDAQGDVTVVDDGALFGKSVLRVFVSGVHPTEGDEDKVCKKLPTPPRLNAGFALDLSQLTGEGYAVDLFALGQEQAVSPFAETSFVSEVEVAVELLPLDQIALKARIRSGGDWRSIPETPLASRVLPFFFRLQWRAADSPASPNGFLSLEAYVLLQSGPLLVAQENLTALDNSRQVIEELRLGWLGGGSVLASPGYFQLDEVTVRKEGSIEIPSPW